MRLIEQVFKLLAPHRCLSCDSEGSLLCAWCTESALPDAESRCYICNSLAKDFKVCQSCRRKTALRHLWVRTEYSDIARQLVHQMKFKYSGEAADLIAKELVNTIPALSPDTIIVHVPTITSHVRQRGFDHAKRIASRIATATPYMHASLLVRTGQHRQVGSTRQVRLNGVRDSFRLKGHSLAEGANILLVDDVLTTGATIEAAALALKKAGARKVDAIIFARAK